MDLWERGQHAGLVGDAEAEGAAQEGRAAFNGEEEDEAVDQGFYKTLLLRKLRQAVRKTTDRKGGGCLLPEDKFTKTGRPVADVLRENHRDMRAPPCGKPHVRRL